MQRQSFLASNVTLGNTPNLNIGLETLHWFIRPGLLYSQATSTLGNTPNLNIGFLHERKPYIGSSDQDQCCSGSGFLESDPAELWDFFGFGAGLDFIFAQAGSGLPKTFWTLINFFAFCFFPAKILFITWVFWCWMMWFILFFNLSRMVDFSHRSREVTWVARTSVTVSYGYCLHCQACKL